MTLQQYTQQYTQHDWGNLTWALMLTAMVMAVFIAMVLFLVMANRDKRDHGHGPRRGA
jgi:heme/copper-type cytochrome/quinol oxidase subunit 2